MLTLVAIGERVRVSDGDVRSDLSHRRRAGGSVTTENVDIVADETDGAGSAAIAISALALKFGMNQISPFLAGTFSYRHVNKI